MVEEKEIEEKKTETPNSESEDWATDFQGEREQTGGNWFKDAVPEGSISFQTTIEFLDEGTKTKNNFDDTVVRFSIIDNGVDKTLDVKTAQFDILKAIAEQKPLVGKKAVWERTGTTRKDTRRHIKFVQ